MLDWIISKIKSNRPNDQIQVVRRNKTIEDRIDDVIFVLENCKFDILYMEKLKQPLNEFEQQYFVEQIYRINGAIKVLDWLKTKVTKQKKFLGLF